MAELTTLTESMEMYIKTIYHLEIEKGAARVSDIARRLDVLKSSVTGALRALHKRGLVNYSPYDLITLTEDGRTRAHQVVQKYAALRDFFTEVLRLDEVAADEQACRMEHYLSEVLLERLSRFVEYYRHCPYEPVQWNEGLGRFCRSNNIPDCAVCSTVPTRPHGQPAPQ